MNKTNDYKFNLPTYSDPVDIEDLNDNFRGIDDALMAGLCKKDYTGNNMGSSDPSARKYAWAPWFEIVNDNEFDVVVTDRNAPVESEEATINIAAGQTFRKYINGRYYMNFYVQDQHDVTFKWFTNAETYINESGGGGGGTGTVTSVSVQGGSGSHLTGSGNPIETSGTITINVDEGYSIPSDNEQTAWDGKAADLKAEIDSSTYVLTLQLKDSSGNLIGSERTIDLPLETMVVDGEYDSQTQKIKLELKNGNYVEFSVADLVSGLQTELSASNKLNPDYIAYDSSHRAVSDTEKNTWNAKQNAIDSDHKLSSSLVSFSTAEAAALASGIDSSKVGQISTNQTNILYTLNRTGKNICKNNTASTTINNVTFTVNEDGSVTVAGTPSATTTYVFCALSDILETGKDYMGYGLDSGQSSNIYFGLLGVSGVPNKRFYDSTTPFSTADISTKYTDVIIRVDGSSTVNITLHPMICEKTLYDIDPSYVPFALPNYDLTRLEAEDRASLAEVVDSGAKNLLDTSLAAIKANGNNVAANISWNNNVGTVPNTGVSFTVNANGTITVNTNGAATARANLYFECHLPSTTNNVNYTLSSGGAYSAGAYYVAMFNQSESANPTASPIADFSSKGGTGWMCYLSVLAGTTVNNITFSPMCCTKAAFGVSSAFVPFGNDPFYQVPINHNMIYRGRNLGATLTDAQHTALSSGNFTDLYLGDYWTKTVTIPAGTYTGGDGEEVTVPAQTNITLKAVIADFDTFYAGYASSYAGINTHHAAVIVTGFSNVVWNKTNSTAGGYVASLIHKWLVGSALPQIETWFGSAKVLSHQKLLTNAITGDAASGWTWSSQKISLLSENQMYGSKIWGNSKIANGGYEPGEAFKHLNVFNHIDANMLFGNKNIWLRDIASAVEVARLGSGGRADFLDASNVWGAPAALILLS